MSKQKNPNIGHIECFACSALSALRKNKNGDLYYDCMNCGRIAPNHAGGQSLMKERAVIWGPEGAPSSCPKWIAENYPYALAVRFAKDATPPAKDAGPTPKPPAAKESASPAELPEAPPPPPPAAKPESAPKQTDAPPRTSRGFAFLE